MDHNKKAELLAEYGQLIAQYVQKQESETQQRLKEIETELGLSEREIIPMLMDRKVSAH